MNIAMDCLRLYIGCLPYAAQREEIERLFEEASIPIKSIDISIDRFSGRNPGYCFVNFHAEPDVVAALQKIEGQYVRDRPVKLRLATPRRASGPQASSWWSRPAEVFKHDPSPYAFDRWTRYDTSETWTSPVNEGRRLYVGGLPRFPTQAALNVEMRKLFRSYNVEAISKMVSPHPLTNSQPGDHHYCFVDFATVQETDQAALAFNGQPTPWGWRYRIDKSRKLPTKLMREQLSGTWPGQEPMKRERDLDGNWRRMDPTES